MPDSRTLTAAPLAIMPPPPPLPDDRSEPPASDGNTAGSGRPTGTGRPDKRTAVITCLGLVAVIFIGGPLAASALLDGIGPTGPEMQTIGFGTGGTECTLTGVASTFRSDAEIRDVLTFAPAMPVGSTVTITLARNGTEIASRHEILQIDQATDCLYSVLSPLTVGHYRLDVDVHPGMMPAMTGEFDVTQR